MSDENDDGGSFIDHLFNAFGHLSRAKSQRDAEQSGSRGGAKKKSRKIKIASFDEAPAPAPTEKPCCTAKR